MKRKDDFLGFPVYEVSDEERFEYNGRTFIAGCSYKYKCIFVFEEFSMIPSGKMREFILAHEVGHLMSTPDRSEEAANAWACRFFGEEGEMLLAKCTERSNAIHSHVRESLKYRGLLPKSAV